MCNAGQLLKKVKNQCRTNLLYGLGSHNLFVDSSPDGIGQM